MGQGTFVRQYCVPALLTIWLSATLEKSANCISMIGRIPSMAAPIAVPTIASSLIGVLRTRSGKFFRETFGGLERAAEFPAHVLAVDENARIFAQKMRLRLADGFEIGDAHEIRSAISRVASAHQSSSLATGAASRWAVSTASSTSAAISERHLLERLGVDPVRFRGSAAQCALHESCAHGSLFIFAGT